MDVMHRRGEWTPSKEYVKGTRAAVQRVHVGRHPIDREIAADAEATARDDRQVLHRAEGERVDVREDVRMAEALRVKAEPEHFLLDDFGPAIGRQCAGG